MPRAPAAETVDQRPGLGLDRHAPVALQLLRKIIEDAERFGPVVRAGQTAQLRADRALRERVKLAGLGDRLVGTQLVAGVEPLLGMTEQRIDAQSIPVRPLYRQPILEARGVGDLEAVQKRAVDQRRRLRPIALLHQLLELVRVELHRAVQQLDDIALSREPVADVVADHANGLTNRLARRGVVLVRPQQPDQLLPGAAALGRARQIQEQRDVFLPEQLGRRFRAVHCDFERPQCLEANHRVAAQLSARARARAVSARAPNGAGACAQCRTTDV